eukprot:9048564-Pyramimonas_sp.AAC.3
MSLVRTGSAMVAMQRVSQPEGHTLGACNAPEPHTRPRGAVAHHSWAHFFMSCSLVISSASASSSPRFTSCSSCRHSSASSFAPSSCCDCASAAPAGGARPFATCAGTRTQTRSARRLVRPRAPPLPPPATRADKAAADPARPPPPWRHMPSSASPCALPQACALQQRVT